MSPFVKMPHHPGGLDCELSPGVHTLAIELFGLHFVKAIPLGGPPSVAPMRQHRQGDVHLHVEPHLTGQPVAVKDMDADAAAGLDAMAPGGASEEVPCPDVAGVGHAESRLGMPQAVNGHLPYRASIPRESRGLIHLAEVWRATFGDSEHGLGPGRRGEGVEAPHKGGAPTPNRHTPEATLMHPGEFGRGDALGVKGEPLGIMPRDRLPALAKPPQFPGVISPREVRMRLA